MNSIANTKFAYYIPSLFDFVPWMYFLLRSVFHFKTKLTTPLYGFVPDRQNLQCPGSFANYLRPSSSEPHDETLLSVFLEHSEENLSEHDFHLRVIYLRKSVSETGDLSQSRRLTSPLSSLSLLTATSEATASSFDDQDDRSEGAASVHGSELSAFDTFDYCDDGNEFDGEIYSFILLLYN